MADANRDVQAEIQVEDLVDVFRSSQVLQSVFSEVQQAEGGASERGGDCL